MSDLSSNPDYSVIEVDPSCHYDIELAVNKIHKEDYWHPQRVAWSNFLKIFYKGGNVVPFFDKMAEICLDTGIKSSKVNPYFDIFTELVNYLLDRGDSRLSVRTYEEYVKFSEVCRTICDNSSGIENIIFNHSEDTSSMTALLDDGSYNALAMARNLYSRLGTESMGHEVVSRLSYRIESWIRDYSDEFDQVLSVLDKSSTTCSIKPFLIYNEYMRKGVMLSWDLETGNSNSVLKFLKEASLEGVTDRDYTDLKSFLFKQPANWASVTGVYDTFDTLYNSIYLAGPEDLSYYFCYGLSHATFNTLITHLQAIRSLIANVNLTDITLEGMFGTASPPRTEEVLDVLTTLKNNGYPPPSSL